MDDFIELIIEILGSFFEFDTESEDDKKINKYIRISVLILVLLLYTAIIVLMIFVGIKTLPENSTMGILILVLDIFLIFIGIYVFIKKFREIRSKNNDSIGKGK